MKLDGSWFESVDVAGPGFMNFRMGSKWYSDVLKNVAEEGDSFCNCNIGEGKKLMVEFVSANPTGPMHMGNARGGVLPCDYLRAAHILRAPAGGNVDAVYGVPRGKLALRRLKAVAAVKGALQQRGNVLRGLLLLERGGNDHAGIVRIAAQPQHMVKLRLRNGKSEGRLCALRFFNGYNLFRFGGEKG